MAIQHRRGIYSRFDPTKLLPGEWAVVLSDDPGAVDGMSVYICFAAGVVKRMATYEDMVANVAEAASDVVAEISARYTQDIEEATAAAEQATREALEGEESRCDAEAAREEAEARREAAYEQMVSDYPGPLADEDVRAIMTGASQGGSELLNGRGLAYLRSLLSTLTVGELFGND